LDSFARRETVKYGAHLAVTLGAFSLISSAEVSAALSGRHASRATRAAAR